VPIKVTWQQVRIFDHQSICHRQQLRYDRTAARQHENVFIEHAKRHVDMALVGSQLATHDNVYCFEVVRQRELPKRPAIFEDEPADPVFYSAKVVVLDQFCRMQNPCHRVYDLNVDDPAWKGLSDIDVIRLRCAAEQLVHIHRRRNQMPLRDFAIFMVLLHTGLRISELLALDYSQYHGRQFVNVKRKGKKVTRRVFLAKNAREALDRYIAEERGMEPGPLICSRTGKRLARQNVDDILKQIAGQGNTRLAKDQHIHLSAHLLRHTMLRKTAEKHGVQYAMELAGHTSSRYIWRYVQPSQEEKEAALEDLF
jgi:integrase